MRLSSKQIMRSAVLFIGIVIVIYILVSLFSGPRGDLSKSFLADDIVMINVSTDIGDIQIISHEGDEIRVQVEGKSVKKPSKYFKLNIKDKNNELTIKTKVKSKLFSFRKASSSYTVLVELPRKEYEKIQVHADVANVHVGSIQANEAHVTANVGNMTIKDVKGEINAATEVGDVAIDLQNITNNIVAEAKVGNVVVETKEAPLALQTQLISSIGNSIINLPNEVDGSIGIGGPIVDLTVEVGNVSLLLSGE